MKRPTWSLDHFRERLAYSEALPQLVVLGMLSGLATALLISLFRLVVDGPLGWALGNANDFESLPVWARFLLPVVGSLLLLIILRNIAAPDRSMGVVHVLERLAYHQGRLPLSNMLNQLLCATLALISGHSVGREGPAVHLGAACSSGLGQLMQLPHNSLRLLVGCGTAAAIAAAFNTPLAGVIFAMEVVLLEYSVIGFVPIMVAAVTADVSIRLMLGSSIELNLPALAIGSLAEVPYIMLMGFCIGLLAAGFNQLLKQTTRLNHYPLSWRIIGAGVLTGLVAIPVPEVMGIGYDTVSAALAGEIALNGLLILIAAKCLLTPVIIGLGIPAGFIAPTLFIGAMAGGALGIVGATLVDQEVSQGGFYAMIGMSTMMGTVLNAPLAALTAMLELTSNPNIILPGMIAIVTGNITVRYLFRQPSLFITLLQTRGLDYHPQPLTQALSGAAVGSLMNRDFIYSEQRVSWEQAMELTYQDSHLLITSDQQRVMLNCDALRQWLKQHTDQATIDLTTVPIDHLRLSPIPFRATLKEALDRMNDSGVDTLYVENGHSHTIGLLSRKQLEQYYLEE